jgi:oligopeptidase B
MKNSTRIFLVFFFAAFLMAGCSGTESHKMKATPPIAKKVPEKLEKHGDVRIDPYFWMNRRDDPEVIAYLNAENSYLDTMLAHTKDLQETLFEEIKGRFQQDDNSVPYKLGDFYYYYRFEEGKEYPFYCRKKGSLEAAEELMLDGNKLAEGTSFFQINNTEPSPKPDILAYSADTVGRRKYTIYFKDLLTGETLPDQIEEVTGNMAWANDNKTLFYSKKDPVTLRSYRIYKHVLGTDPASDPLVYEEADETFNTYVTKSRSRKYLMLISSATVSDEYRFLDADTPDGDFQMLQPRERDLEYSVDHHGDSFFIRTNLGAQNFRLMKAPVEDPGKENWEEVIPHRDDVLLEGVDMFKDYMVLEERENGLNRIRIRGLSDGRDRYMDFDEPTYSAYVSNNPEFETQTLRYQYESLTTPSSTYDYDMETGEKVLRKEQSVLGGFNRENYESRRIFANAADGTRIPISLVFRKGISMDGANPLLLYAYGSYGASMDAYFSIPRLSLLDRGFIFAIGHVRGGSEMGRKWYEDGKLLNKRNTFTDFISCGEFLVSEKYTRPEKLFAMGGSAGGLLMGAIVNMRPDLFKGVVAAVPFVDVLTTMLDESIPLTTGEYDEWGNPNDKIYYDYMRTYSPYDNVKAANYPNLLVTTGYHDSQVQYWEPAKWVARLREMKTGDNLLLFHTNMDAGHGGASGRFEPYRETAMEFAFLLDLAGIKN